jgi:small subunit ribosomal protein S6
MKAYELMIIYSGDLDDAAVSQGVQRVRDQVAAGGGEVRNRLPGWGRRRLAYPIDHKVEGIYEVLEIVTSAANLDDLERMLRIADEVVRHKLIRLPEKEARKRGLLGEASPAAAG